MLGLNRDNRKLIDFICSEEGEKMMQDYSVSIHVEAGDAFYNNFNTNESFYDFLLAQQDEKQKNNKKENIVLSRL